MIWLFWPPKPSPFLFPFAPLSLSLLTSVQPKLCKPTNLSQAIESPPFTNRSLQALSFGSPLLSLLFLVYRWVGAPLSLDLFSELGYLSTVRWLDANLISPTISYPPNLPISPGPFQKVLNKSSISIFFYCFSQFFRFMNLIWWIQMFSG